MICNEEPVDQHRDACPKRHAEMIVLHMRVFLAFVVTVRLLVWRSGRGLAAAGILVYKSDHVRGIPVDDYVADVMMMLFDSDQYMIMNLHIRPYF